MRNNLWIGSGILGRGGIPMLGTGKRGLRTRIKDLFANSEQGFAYDPNDLTTLYQDAAGTIPTALTGQPVARIKDISGKGLDAIQTESSMRPLLKNIPYFLEYDAVDDFLSVNIASTLTNCTVITSTRNNPVSILTGQTIQAGALSIKPERAYIIINRALTSHETELLTQHLKKQLTTSVVKESSGLQTVLYTAKGQPTYMNIIQKYDMSTIDVSMPGTHPAFIVDGVEKPEIFIGTYQGKIVNGELLSLPNVDPTVSTSYDNFLIAARANGNGHHLITNAEWSAVALQCHKNNTQPMGNSYYGHSSEDPLLIGRPGDAGNSGDARTLTGSGPVQWRHNGKNNGIADMSGNIWEWNSGVRLVNGEIQVIDNNNAAKLAIDLSAASSEWKAIDGATGVLVAPNGLGTTAGTVKFAASGSTADYTIYGASFGAVKNLSTTKPVGVAALNKLKALCLFPHIDAAATFNSDSIYINLTIEAQPFRGGAWDNGAVAGVFALNSGFARSDAGEGFGSRPAFVSL